MIFIESALFTKLLSNYLEDDDYHQLQNFLLEQPDAGDLIQASGGLSKLRWKLGNKGKRAGIRVIYYWQLADEKIYFLTLFAKNEMTDLSIKEKKILTLMLESWIK